jgi:hypothetical protein
MWRSGFNHFNDEGVDRRSGHRRWPRIFTGVTDRIWSQRRPPSGRPEACRPLAETAVKLRGVTPTDYGSFQLGEQISTAEDAKGRGGWLMVLTALSTSMFRNRLLIADCDCMYGKADRISTASGSERASG